MITRILTSLFVIALLIAPASAHAAVGSEKINSLTSNIVLSKDGSAEVTETIVYDFGPSFRHGIFRKIPTRYPLESGQKYVADFQNGGVTQDGSKAEVDTSSDGDYTVLKIGDPDKTINGPHSYVIRYRLSPMVFKNDTNSVFNFNAIGNGWEVPIQSARATITLPDGMTPSAAHCYTGPYGSKNEANCVLNGTTATLASPLAGGEAMTVAFDLPANAFGNYLEPVWLTTGEWIAIIVVLLIFLLVTGLLASILIVFLVRRHRGKKRRSAQTVVAEYEAPDKLTAGEIGYLVDDTSDMKEITATLIDLAVRGYIKIEQTRPKSFLRNAQYKIIKLKPYTDTQNYEQILLNAIVGGADSVEMHKLDNAKTSAAVTDVHSKLKKHLQAKNFYHTKNNLQGFWSRLFDTGVMSDEGAKEWARVSGFKLYLGVAEKDRLKFTDAPERTPERFNALLPYAVALGVEKEWAKQFEGIDVTQGVGWYSGNNSALTHGLIASSFVNDFSSNFGSAVNSSFVAPSSSGSGGGFSGGGGGGGGGGSW